MDEKALCKDGQCLYNAVDYRKTNSYDDYRRHLLQCKKCQDGLNLSRNNLLRIKEDVETKGYIRRRRNKSEFIFAVRGDGEVCKIMEVMD